MKYGLNIPKKGRLDLVSLGAMVHRLDPGIVPFKKAANFAVHVSGGKIDYFWPEQVYYISISGMGL